MENIKSANCKHYFAVILSSRALARLDNITADQKHKTKIQMENVEEEAVEGGRWVKMDVQGCGDKHIKYMAMPISLRILCDCCPRSLVTPGR